MMQGHINARVRFTGGQIDVRSDLHKVRLMRGQNDARSH